MKRTVALSACLAVLTVSGCSEEGRVEAVEVIDGGMTLRVYVVSTPDRPNEEVEVVETGDEIRISATVDVPFGGSEDGPGVFYCSEIGLEEPVGDRRIVDASRDETPARDDRPCFDGED